MTAIQRVQAVELTRTYGRRYALKKADFALDAGRITAVIGPNGAGKTTSFNLLARRITPTSGSVLFDGQVATLAAEHRRICGYLSHSSFLYSALTARENLELIGGLYGVQLEGVPTILERIGLTRAADRPVRQFSRGMVQRLAIGRLLLVDPDVWLLDEPASGLDQAGRDWLADEIRQLAQVGKIVALSSHSRTLVQSLATDAVVLKQGRVVFGGPVADDRITELFSEYIG